MSFLSTVRKLCPVEVGPWWGSRRYVLNEMIKLNVQPGDIICRKGNAYVYGFFPFSEFICYLTQSKYSHAALIIDVNGEDILTADVNTTGLRRQYITDWTDDIRGDDILVLRYAGKNQNVVRKLAVENAKAVLAIDPTYDDEFLENNEGVNWYCVELVCWCYQRAGVMLCDDIPIQKLPKWKQWLNPIAKAYGVDYTTSVWCVGNKDIGIISSPDLKEVGCIPYVQVSKHSNHSHKPHHVFRGV